MTAGLDWAQQVAPRFVEGDVILSRLARSEVVSECRLSGHKVMVGVGDAHRARLNSVAETLSDLWPGFPFPEGVGLAINHGVTWDAEDRVLRSGTGP